jgi:hypothetical protein
MTTNRYQQPRRKRSNEIPLGWRSTAGEKEPIEEIAPPSGAKHGSVKVLFHAQEPKRTPKSLTIEQIALCNAVADKPHYDDSPQEWDRVLEILNLKLCYQPAVAIILREGRWRTLSSGQCSYIARAAYNQALSLKLPDRSDSEFRVVKSSSRYTAPKADANGFDEEGKPLSEEDAMDRMSLKHRDHKSSRDYCPPVPEHLRCGGDEYKYDWAKVAAAVVLKSRMIESVALALRFKHEESLGRDEAVKKVRGQEQKRKLSDAWKWCDRNWETRILPVMRGEVLGSEQTELPAQRSSFMPPGIALITACLISKRNRKKIPAAPGPETSITDAPGSVAFIQKWNKVFAQRFAEDSATCQGIHVTKVS